MSLEKLRLDVLPQKTKRAFLRCVELPLFKRRGWYLAGGTALALQVGHRQSVDLDFFTSKKTFEERKIEEQFADAGKWTTTSLSLGTLYGEFLGAKISFISYPFFRAADPLIQVGSVLLLSPSDIAVMKITAVSQRGRKRDFFDLYWLSLHILPLEKSLERVKHQYAVDQNFNHILKSLVYFEDAEDDPEPDIFFKATWWEVKSFFTKEVSFIAEKMIGLT